MTTTDPAPAPTPVTAPPAGSAERIRLCERLLTDLRTEIARADSKASVLVAALGMTAGVFSGVLAGRGWTPAALSTPGTALWWSGILALTVSLLALLLAVLPRYRSGSWAPGRPLTYFGDIRQAAAQGHLESAIADTERDPAAALTASLVESSRIAARKHQWIRAGLIAFCVGTVLLPASLLIG
ncbi:Pycsar system effector family protein [Streptomyces sp. NPDC046759]|uniref:Pycsar system effector family protein n=1 Tax=Streptomyces sp. NPDC046759 TaxID=3155019 RepID=UPI0033F0C491